MNVDEDVIRQWHVEKGWIDVGYNVVIPRNGMVQIGRPLDARGAHVAGYNARALGICLVGGLDEDGEPEANYTQAQYDALEATIHFLRKYAPLAKIQGHRDFPNVAKACPCFDVRDWLRERGIPWRIAT